MIIPVPTTQNLAPYIMNRILILTYYWPPAGGPGVQRWLKFVKYLEDFDCKPYILTVADGTYSAIDNDLVKEIPEGLMVYKTKSRDPFRFYTMLKGKKDGSVSVALININKERSLIDRLSMYIRSNFFIPDARKGWMPYAYKEALNIIKEQNIDIIVTTGPPQSTHLIGLKLKRKTGLNWIADLRDPWTTVYYNDMLPRTQKTRRIDKAYEDEVLGAADAVTVVSPGMQKEFKDRNPNVQLVMNGFDMADMRGGAVNAVTDDKFRMTYTGNFKPNQHIPEIWNAICELIDGDEQFKNDFQLRFVGNLDSSVPEYFRDKGHEGILEIISYVPHAEATGLMSYSDVLLFVVPQSRNNKLIITGKLFEYLASGTPIYSTGPVDGDAATILNQTGRSGMIDYNDKEKFKEQILHFYKDWKVNGGSLPKLDVSMLDQYSRRSSAGLMAGIINNLIH